MGDGGSGTFGRRNATGVNNKTMLVDAIVIGAQKGGSTALLVALQNYPLIAMADRELHFFDNNDAFAKGVEWYHFRPILKDLKH